MTLYCILFLVLFFFLFNMIQSLSNDPLTKNHKLHQINHIQTRDLTIIPLPPPPIEIPTYEPTPAPILSPTPSPSFSQAPTKTTTTNANSNSLNAAFDVHTSEGEGVIATIVIVVVLIVFGITSYCFIYKNKFSTKDKAYNSMNMDTARPDSADLESPRFSQIASPSSAVPRTNLVPVALIK